jgi:hypothetical protein
VKQDPRISPKGVNPDAQPLEGNTSGDDAVLARIAEQPDNQVHTYSIPSDLTNEFARDRQEILAQSNRLASAISIVDSNGYALAIERQQVNRRDPNAVAAFNNKSKEYNESVQQAGDLKQRFSLLVSNYNAKLRKYGTPVR